jgi:O-antigen/teichoic acid export membrane protein
MSITGGDIARPAAEDILTTAKAGDRVIRGSVWRLAATGAGILLGFATAMLLLRHLGVAESGRYVTVMSLVAIPVFVVDYGLNVAASRELALRGPHDRTLIANILGQKLLIMPAAVLLIVCFALVAGYPARMVIGTALAGTGALIAALGNVLLLRLTVELRNAGLALLDFARQAVALAGVALLVALGASLTPFFAVLIVGSLVVVTLIPLVAGPRAFVRPRFERHEQRLLLRTALPMATALALGQVYFRFVIVLMSLISDPTQTGYFGGSLRATENLVIMPILVAGVVLPLLTAAARDDLARLRGAIEGLGEAALIAGVLLVLFTVRAAEPVMVLIGGPAFRPAGAVLRIEVGTLIFLALDQVWTVSLLALGRQRELILTNALALVGVALFAVVLVPPFGAQGGAAASVLGELVLATLIYWRLSRATGRVMVGTRFLTRLLVAATVASVALILPGLPDLVAAALAGVLFVGVGQLIGMVPQEVPEAFAPRKWLRR